MFLHYLSLFSSEDTSAIFNKDEWIQIDESRQSSISPPPPITYEDQDSQAKIFIAIAAFRDNRCSITLKNLFTKAKYPNRINIGNLVKIIHFVFFKIFSFYYYLLPLLLTLIFRFG